MGFHRVSLWSVEDGAASSGCFAALEDAAVAAGGTTSEPWSLQIGVQRAESSKGSSELLERRTGDASKDLHVVSSYTTDPSQLILVHRNNKTILEAETGAKSLLDSYLRYKTRATLHIEGIIYPNCGDFRIALARATQRPSNRFIGIVVDIEATGLETADAADGILTEMTQMFREAAQSDTPIAKLQEVERNVDSSEYDIAEDAWKQLWALQLVQLLSG